MALSNKKKENLKESLKKSGAIAPADTMIDAAYANYIQFGIGGVLLQRPKPGFACFTEEKFIWTGAGDDIIITAGQPTSSTPQPRGTNLVKIYRK